MKQIDNIITELRRPFTPEAVQFKIQSAKGAKALIVCYIDARQVAERLNHVCPEQWSSEFTPREAGSLVGVECAITINPGSGGAPLTRTDVGVMEGGIGGLKAVYSDAFKRAGVPWGIGASLYYTPKFYGDKSKLREFKEKFYMSDEVEAKARKEYGDWLKREGIERFGEPLDMGDTVEAQGDVEVAEDEPPAGKAPAAKPAKVTMPKAGKNAADNVIRNAYRGFIRKAESEAAAKREFGLWLNANDIPSELDKLSEEQQNLVLSFLTEGEPG
jgi:hypothetical protein